MKRVLLHILKSYLRIGLFFYFRRIKVYGIDKIPLNQPTLILCNHQNALLDALLIAVSYRGYAHFLTRASVFKKSFVSRLLKFLNLIPVYRIRDGWSNLTNNHSVFDQCTDLLGKNKTVVIFPEGGHNLVRRVRPLSKGFTRIVFDTLKKYPGIDLQLVPAGVSFQSAISCPDQAALFIGKPLAASDFFSESSGGDITAIKDAVHSEIRKLTVHIPENEYDSVLDKLEGLGIDFTQPKPVNAAINSGNYSELSEKHAGFKSKPVMVLLLKIWLFLPYLFWRYYVRPKIKEEEFISTFRFAIAMTVVPFYLVLIFILILILATWTWAMAWLVLSLLIALLAVKL